ncbi:hypothetical protein CCASP_06820 [Corynebacterium caspium DSM 44850]|nr:hypothetical protein CCASP_06820 [Corynebacterium caspium DSM 44850]
MKLKKARGFTDINPGIDNITTIATQIEKNPQEPLM